MFVAAFGKSTLGLAYSLAAAETLISPAMPSTTARAGGIFMPIMKFLAKGAGSEPDSGRTKLGAFLVQVRRRGVQALGAGLRPQAAGGAAASSAGRARAGGGGPGLPQGGHPRGLQVERPWILSLLPFRPPGALPTPAG
jgi:di/tricarboxylate transporter